MWAEIDQVVLAHAAVLPGYLSHLSNISYGTYVKIAEL
jgi:hypothetical protein